MIEAANALNTKLKELGMLSRHLSYNEETGVWVDVIVWESSGTAKAAPENMIKDDKAGAFFALMLPESVTMQHLRVMASAP